MMSIGDPGDLSLGQWVAIVAAWNARNGTVAIAPPSEEEFEAAVATARAVLH